MPIGAEAWHGLSREVTKKGMRSISRDSSASKTPQLPITVEKGPGKRIYELALRFHATARAFSWSFHWLSWVSSQLNGCCQLPLRVNAHSSKEFTDFGHHISVTQSYSKFEVWEYLVISLFERSSALKVSCGAFTSSNLLTFPQLSTALSHDFTEYFSLMPPCPYILYFFTPYV